MGNSQVLMRLCDYSRIRTHNDLVGKAFFLFSSKLLGEDRLVKSVKLLLFKGHEVSFSSSD